MQLNDFSYNLPKQLIAQYPSEKRDMSRLLVLHRDTGRIEHRIFRDIVEYFRPDDLLVLNNTKVVPSRLFGTKLTGGRVEALVLYKGHGTLRLGSARLTTNRSGQAWDMGHGGEYEALLRPARGCNAGAKLVFADGKIQAEVTRIENGRRFLKFEGNGNLDEILDKLGHMPLPPYIRRQDDSSDRERYQTVFASKKGAVAAPTAGLHFTRDILSLIAKRGVDIEYITLHVGYGTFKPVKCEDIRQHKMEKEYFEIEKGVFEKINSHKGRIVAVGTTTCRVLETIYRDIGQGTWDMALSQWTDLFIYPSHRFKRVNALLTNFHLPKTTLLMLVSAFCGKELLLKAYQEAIEKKYRFYSYGDAMLIV